MNNWTDDFSNPPASCRPRIQWSWNGEITNDGIEQGLDDFQDKGVGGFFMHARPGLEMGYIQDEWFDVWKAAAQGCQRRGMEWNIYDEYTCPGGHAGGHTVANAPHTAVTELVLVRVASPESVPDGQVLGWFKERGRGKPPKPVEDVKADDLSPDHPLIAAVMRPQSMRFEKGAFPMPDLTHPDATKSFMRTTHERYAATAGEFFGETTKFCFCDEPSFYAREGVLLSRRILLEFENDHGYAFTDHLADFCFGGDNAPAVRWAYWFTLHRLWQENFMEPLYNWCADHKLEFTGHFMENQWPRPFSNADCMDSYRWMQAPGNDLLGFQFHGTTLREHGLYLLNLLELQSVAGQLGRKNIMVESSGADGYGAGYRLFKTCEDFLLAFGVNVMDPHLSHWTLGGARKYDWAQTLTPHSPWWEVYKDHADHVARVVAVQRQGQARNRVLVLHPTLTAWLDAVPAREPWMSAESVEKLDHLRSTTIDFYLELTAGQIDFDLGDELLMADFAEVRDGKLVIGERTYDAVVLPPIMHNWLESTLALVGDYLKQGGALFAAGPAPERIAGQPDHRPAQLVDHHEQWKSFDAFADLVDALRKAVPPRVSAPNGGKLPEHLIWRRTELPGGEHAWFFCAPWEEGVTAEVVLREIGGSVWELNTATGEVRAVEAQFTADGHPQLEISLPARGHKLLLMQPGEVNDPPAGLALAEAPAPPTMIEPRDLTFVQAEACEPNLLLLDYCRPAGPDGEFGEAIHSFAADRENWQRHGFHGNPWTMSHMFKRTWLDYPFPADSGCRVAYEFEIALDEVDGKTLEIVVERPWQYEITLNGAPVPREAFEQWFDREFGKASIADQVTDGRNQLVLKAQPMQALVEIMPVYVRGNFALDPVDAGFRITGPRDIGVGDWREHGLPFYRGWMRYSYTFQTAQKTEALELALPAWQGGAARVWLKEDPRRIVNVLHPPYRARFDTPLEAGEHTVIIEIASTLYNMVGPQHARGLSGPWSWDLSPRQQPAGNDYNLDAAGIME